MGLALHFSFSSCSLIFNLDGSNFIVFWKVEWFPSEHLEIKSIWTPGILQKWSFSALGSYSKTGLQDYPTLSQFHLLEVLYLHWCLWRFYLSFILFLSQFEFPFLLTIISTSSISSSLTSSSFSNINMFWNLTLLLQQYQVHFYGSKFLYCWSRRRKLVISSAVGFSCCHSFDNLDIIIFIIFYSF